MILMPRGVVWPGVTPTNASDGKPRALLAPRRPYFTVHTTGGGAWADADDTPAELRRIQDMAQAEKKPWEYNYVIDTQGVVWEYAGAYLAAHAILSNRDAYGVLLLIGFTGTYPNNVTHWELPTDAMVCAVRELRAWLIERDALAVEHQMLRHKEMPGAATADPDPRQGVDARWVEMTTPINQEEQMSKAVQVDKDPAIFAVTPALTAVWMQAGVDLALAELDLLELRPDGSAFPISRLAYKGLELRGPLPNAGPTVADDFAKHTP